MKRVSLLLLLVLGVLAALWFFGQRRTVSDRSNSSTPLLTEHMVQRGIKAAQEQDWQKAIDSFRFAHSTNPQLPGPMYNLALAHDRAAHILVAICWYEAFLVSAPAGKTRSAVERRIRELDAMIRADITKLADAAIDIAIVVAEAEEKAPTTMKLQLLSHFRTSALIDGQLGDVAHTIAMSERLRKVDPNDGWWLDAILVVTSEVAMDLADRGFRPQAEQIVGCLPDAQATEVRQYFAQLNETEKTPNAMEPLKGLSTREKILGWSAYADEIVNGTHHRLHVVDLHAVDQSRTTGPIPEMGIGPFVESIRWSAAPNSQTVIDGVKRLYLTYAEIRFRRGLAANSK